MVCSTLFTVVIVATQINVTPPQTSTIQDCVESFVMAQAKVIEYKQLRDKSGERVYSGKVYRKNGVVQELVWEVDQNGKVTAY